MTLEEAIKILQYSFPDPWILPNADFRDAVKLGIEALKLIKRNRRYTPQPYNVKLPGETDD